MDSILFAILAIAGLGLLFGLGLAYASKKFEVKVDERVALVRDALPGANCGACGYSGCDAYADNIVTEGAKINLCPVGGEDTVNKIAEIMGVEAGSLEKKVARVMCRGSWDNAKIKFDYDGILDCRIATSMHGGPSACSYGCIGMGSCVKVCAFNAIKVENGLAVVNEEKCTACGNCVEECPKGIIELVPAKSKYSVLCKSKDKGGDARKNCSTACIGCSKCVKECPFEAITVENFLAKIDYSKCKNCGKCMKVCPTGAIQKFIAHK